MRCHRTNAHKRLFGGTIKTTLGPKLRKPQALNEAVLLYFPLCLHAGEISDGIFYRF